MRLLVNPNTDEAQQAETLTGYTPMKTTTTIYNVGDKVKVKPGKEHDTMTKNKSGTIVEISTPALGIRFDGMTMTHKWYADDEVTKA
jgi:hypothetical protein